MMNLLGLVFGKLCREEFSAASMVRRYGFFTTEWFLGADSSELYLV